MIGFCLYEFCFGVYRPASGLLRSEYIPDDSKMRNNLFIIFIHVFLSFYSVRATVMNYLRVPQLLLVLVILLSVSSHRIIMNRNDNY